eukprot:SAG22_NODE_1163_length_5300_cov_18.540088_1_plen_206_part_00
MLRRGGSLAPDAVLTSPDGNVKLHNQLDANIVLVSLGKAIWSTGTLDEGCAPRGACQYLLELTAEGVLRLVAPNGTVMWTPPGLAAAAPAAGHGLAAAAELVVQDDCNLVLKAGSEKVLWATGTKCAEAGPSPPKSSPPAQAEDHPAAASPPLFYILRNILKSATYMADVAAATTAAIPDMTFVDPYSLGLLVKCHTKTLDCSTQ